MLKSTIERNLEINTDDIERLRSDLLEHLWAIKDLQERFDSLEEYLGIERQDVRCQYVNKKDNKKGK